MRQKTILNSLILLLTAALLFSCEESTGPDNGEEPKPPGYQEEIPWPSLADSPWPMHHSDPQSTGRTDFNGPTVGSIDWKIDSVHIIGGVSVGVDSTIYFISIMGPKKGLVAAEPDGTIKWVQSNIQTNGEMQSTPVIASDGTIYISNGIYGKLFAINPDGTIKWEFETEGSAQQFKISLDKEGNIYLLIDVQNAPNILYCININGSLSWSMRDDRFKASTLASISFSPNGETIYVPGTTPSLFAIDVNDQSIKWTFGEEYSRLPLVDSKGNIYLHSKVDSINNGKRSWFSLTPEGKVRWGYAHNNDRPGYGEGTIDRFGNTYFAFDTLYSIDYRGKLNLKLNLNGYSGGPVICDGRNNIYLANMDRNSLLSVNRSGSINWEVVLDEEQFIGSYPAITYNSRIIYPTYQSDYLYSIK